MADGPQLPNLHALGLLDNKQSGGGDGANEKETPEIVVEGSNKLAGTIAKLLGGFLGGLIPTNMGEVSAFSGLESKGIAGSSINPGKGGAQGGVLANIAGAFIKNSAITDHTTGVGGNASGEGGSGGGEGGGGNTGGHGFESYATNSGMGEVFIAAGGGNHFDYSDVPRSMLGNLSSPIFGDMGMAGRGAGMDLG